MPTEEKIEIKPLQHDALLAISKRLGTSADNSITSSMVSLFFGCTSSIPTSISLLDSKSITPSWTHRVNAFHSRANGTISQPSTCDIAQTDHLRGARTPLLESRLLNMTKDLEETAMNKRRACIAAEVQEKALIDQLGRAGALIQHGEHEELARFRVITAAMEREKQTASQEISQWKSRVTALEGELAALK
ncbi:hypothetical protein BJ742DRAFT_770021 [Cladochytrium replicatum]|nr:hypothetical protein BJ742DRAFT_770021 [Cladochytrium replicatum]